MDYTDFDLLLFISLLHFYRFDLLAHLQLLVLFLSPTDLLLFIAHL